MPGTSTSGGRNRKATQAHLLRGTFRPARHAGTRAPEPPAGTPTSPVTLTGDARAEWDRMVSRLKRCGVLTAVDDAVLLEACQLFQETQQLRREDQRLRRLSTTLTRATKALSGADLVAAIAEIVKLQAQRQRLSTASRQGHMAQRQYLIELGLTPLARTRVQASSSAAPQAGDPKKARYLDGIATK